MTTIEDIINHPRIAKSIVHGEPLADRTAEEREAGRERAQRSRDEMERLMEIQRQRIAQLHRPTFPNGIVDMSKVANDNAAPLRAMAA